MPDRSATPSRISVVARRNEADLFAVKVVTDGELGLAAVTVCWEVRVIEAILQEEVTTPFLCPPAPSTVNGTDLGAQEWRDALFLRCGLEPPDLPTQCNGC